MRLAPTANPAPALDTFSSPRGLGSLRPEATLQALATKLLRSHLLLGGQVVSTDTADGETAHVSCLAGEVWITQEGDSRDHVLIEGQSWQSGHPGRIVIEAVSPAAQITID